MLRNILAIPALFFAYLGFVGHNIVTSFSYYVVAVIIMIIAFQSSTKKEHVQPDSTVSKVKVAKIKMGYQESFIADRSQGSTTSTNGIKKSHKWNCKCDECMKRNEQNYIHAHYGGGHR